MTAVLGHRKLTRKVADAWRAAENRVAILAWVSNTAAQARMNGADEWAADVERALAVLRALAPRPKDTMRSSCPACGDRVLVVFDKAASHAEIDDAERVALEEHMNGGCRGE